jgi:hypothetical protein
MSASFGDALRRLVHNEVLQLSVVLLAALLACDPDDTPSLEQSCQPSSDPLQADTVELGTTNDDDIFVALADDATLVRERGSQGGEHVTLATRMFTRSANRWQQEIELVVSGSSTGATTSSSSTATSSSGAGGAGGGASFGDDAPAASRSIGVDGCPGSWAETTAVRLVLPEVGVDLDGVLRITATEEGGQGVLSAERRVKIR